MLDRIREMDRSSRNTVTDFAQIRHVPGYWPVVPHPKQQAFLKLMNLEAFFGGAAGPGKSYALLLAALQFVDVPGYSALIVRRSYPDLTMPNAIMDTADQWLAPTPAKKLKGGRVWLFPSGARLTFGYIQYHRDALNFRGAEFQFIGMDELTYWEQRSYRFMFSRLRRPAHRFEDDGTGSCAVIASYDKIRPVPCGQPREAETHRSPRYLIPSALDGLTLAQVPLRMRSTSNPGDVGHQWVKDDFIDPETRLPDAVFIPARIGDNPSLDREQYIATLMHMDPVDRERVMNGDWDVLAAGGMFNRAWWNVIDRERVPRQGVRWVRYWDKAATRPSNETSRRTDPDYTAGALVGLDSEGLWYIRDIRRFRDSPRGVEMEIARVAELDATRYTRSVWFEQEPGATGVESIDHYRRHVLPGYDVRADRKSGTRDSKPKRAAPLSSAAEAGNVFVVKGDWNRPFFEESELFPDGSHDDMVDAVSGAFFALTKPRPRLVV